MVVSEPSLNRLKKIVLSALFFITSTTANKALAQAQTAEPTSPPPESAAINANASFLQCQQEIIDKINGVPFEYIAEIKSLKVVSKRWLEQQDDQYWKLQSRAQWLFLGVYERSVFQLPSWQLQSFKHERKGLSEKHDLDLAVDHQTQKVSIDAHKNTQPIAYQTDLYDELNHQLRLQIDVACSAGTQEFTYPVAKRKGIKPHHYKKIATETISTEAGKFSAIKLEKLDDDRTTFVWLAPELAYAIVKLVHEEDGDRNSLSIKLRPTLNTAHKPTNT